MMFKLKSAALAVTVAAVTVPLAACGSSNNKTSTTETSTSASGGGDKVAMIFPGPVNDKGFNEVGFMGLKRCESEGLKISYQEKVAVPDFVRTMETDARSANLVIGHGFEFGEIVNQVAPKYPKTKFLVTANPLKPAEQNAMFTSVNSTQGAYLAGTLAALMSKSGKVAGIAGFDFPVLKAQMAAFEAGAKAQKPDIQFKVIYLGTFDDVAKGKEAAQSLAAAGYDVIYHIADAAGIGVINGAKAAGVKVIGWGADQNSVAPDTVIASQITDQAEQIHQICKDFKAGKFAGGTVRVDGLKSGLTGLTKMYNVPADIEAKVEKVKQGIIDGSITDVPSIGGDIAGSGPQGG